MNPKFCRRTCSGRVVYNRKPHEFSLRDVTRITFSLAESVVISYRQDFLQTLRNAIKEGIRNEWYMIKEALDLGFQARENVQTKVWTPPSPEEITVDEAKIFLIRSDPDEVN